MVVVLWIWWLFGGCGCGCDGFKGVVTGLSWLWCFLRDVAVQWLWWQYGG